MSTQELSVETAAQRSRWLMALCVSVAALLGWGCSDDGGSSDVTSSTTTTGGGGGAVGGGGGTGGAGGSGGGGEYVPTTADIGFMPMNPVPSGEQILFNTWSAPDTVKSMQPDGSGEVTIFEAFRVWSMGAARGGDRLAFSCGDPLQEEHYGITIGDAIQHTWLYDFADQSANVLAYGNINDECHHFGPGDSQLLVCRRHDFTPMGMFSGYRLALQPLPSGDSSFLTADEPQLFTLGPQLSNDGQTLYFVEIDLSGGSQVRRLVQQPFAGGAAVELRANAHRMALSPSGQQYVFADTTAANALYVADFNNTPPLMVAQAAGTSPVWSPDGTQLAYLIWSDADNCAHVEIVAADGSEAMNPTRIRDCAMTGEQITKLAWIVRP